MVKKWYRSLNADVATIEDKDELDDRGSETPGAGGIPTPKAVTFVRRIIATAGVDMTAVGNLIAFLRLEGDGMVNDETYQVDGFSVPAAVGGAHHVPAMPSPILNFPVNGGSRIQIFGDSEGDAENNFEMGVTLELVDAMEPPSENADAQIRTRSFSVDVDNVDATNDLTASQGSNAKPNTEVPADVEVLRWIKVTWAVDEAGDGVGILLIRLNGDWLTPNPQHIYAIAHGNKAGTAGSDEGTTHGAFFLDDMNLEVTPGALIEMQAEMVGADLGSGTAGITLGFA